MRIDSSEFVHVTGCKQTNDEGRDERETGRHRRSQRDEMQASEHRWACGCCSHRGTQWLKGELKKFKKSNTDRRESRKRKKEERRLPSRQWGSCSHSEASNCILVLQNTNTKT